MSNLVVDVAGVILSTFQILQYPHQTLSGTFLDAQRQPHSISKRVQAASDEWLQ